MRMTAPYKGQTIAKGGAPQINDLDIPHSRSHLIAARGKTIAQFVDPDWAAGGAGW
jgi:hypothetical protein